MELNFDETLPPVEETFRGIDEHLVLVYHIVQKRIPASFGAIKNGTISKNVGKEQSTSKFIDSSHLVDGSVSSKLFVNFVSSCSFQLSF